jgi:hypothetical protein
MLADDRTTQFALWPHMVTLEGSADRLAAVLESLYNDSALPRNLWALGNNDGIGRRAMMHQLRRQGSATRRLGLAALTSTVSDAIEARVRAAQVKCFVMHLPRLGL